MPRSTGQSSAAASDATATAGGYVRVAISGTTSPDLAELTGTPFAVGAAAFPAPGPAGSGTGAGTSGGAAALSSSVGVQGGTLSTPDGCFEMAVPPGSVPSGGQLWIGETTGAGPGVMVPAELTPALPAHMALASPLFVVSGASFYGSPLARLRYVPDALSGLPPQRLAVYFTAGGAWQPLPTAVDPAGGGSAPTCPGRAHWPCWPRRRCLRRTRG